jgi:acetone carboxylase gamma subunit
MKARSSVTGSMVTAGAVRPESCPECGSLDVRAAEPRWFAVEVDRRSELRSWDSDWVERIEFGCRDCGAAWN